MTSTTPRFTSTTSEENDEGPHLPGSRTKPSLPRSTTRRSDPTRCSSSPTRSASAIRTSSSTRAGTSSPSRIRSSPGTSGAARWWRPVRPCADCGPGDPVVGECVVGPAGRDHFGFSIDGADAEYFKARGEWLHKLPEGLSFTEGAMVEPFSVAYNATVLAGGVDPADVVAVLGGGPIGLLCVMAAAANNATVVLLEPQPGRRDKALQIGARGCARPDRRRLRRRCRRADGRSGVRRRDRSGRLSCGDGASARGRGAGGSDGLCRHRRGGVGAGSARADPVEGAANARPDRVGGALASHDPLPCERRRRRHARS